MYFDDFMAVSPPAYTEKLAMLTVKSVCVFITVCDTSETKGSRWPKHNAEFLWN